MLQAQVGAINGVLVGRLPFRRACRAFASRNRSTRSTASRRSSGSDFASASAMTLNVRADLNLTTLPIEL